MWSPIKGAALLLASLLAGCGFQPLYAPAADGTPAAATQGQRVAVALIADHEGQVLRRRLQQQLSPGGTRGGPVDYRLRVSLETATTRLAIRQDATATRGRFSALATLTLLSADGQTVLLRDRLRSGTTYNQPPESLYGTVVAADTAQDRVMEDLADQIALRVALYLRAHAPDADAAP